jgi:acetyl-CoA hydrolase
LLIVFAALPRSDYKNQLNEYFDRALHECLAKGMAHEPHMLRNAFKMHTNVRPRFCSLPRLQADVRSRCLPQFMENGTMKLDKWD